MKTQKLSERFTLKNKIALAAMAVSIGAMTASHTYAATSCATLLKNHRTWIASPPSGYSRTLAATMVSNYARNWLSNSMSLPEATYYTARLRKASTSSTSPLGGGGYALFNNRVWYKPGSLAPNPFNPDKPDRWYTYLYPDYSSMRLYRNGTSYYLPLTCESNLVQALHTQYLNLGSYRYPISNTKYVMSITRNQMALPK